LRDFAPLDAPPEALADRLSSLGLVVEGLEKVGSALEGVVVAKVLDIKAHPDADRVRLVEVDAGGEPLQIVCGAWNFSVGDLVPLASVGTVLPGGMAISARKVRGQVSQGMLCSPGELGMPAGPQDSDGLMILPPGLAPPGSPFAAAAGVGEDWVFELDISPNRPDALCMAGVARDLAGSLGERFSVPASPLPAPDPTVEPASLEVLCGDLCPRFSATVIEGVGSAISSPQMAWRLWLAGMRPISAVVDVSNYVMLELGQPNHAYDLDRLEGRGLVVRRARQGERLVTLDGQERLLKDGDCVICDAAGDPVGLGGIMGAARAEIGPKTTRILLEAAWFDPKAVAATGRRLGLVSEARTRFERGVDPELAPVATARFISLLGSLPGGGALRWGETLEAVDRAKLPEAPKLRLRTARVNALLGTRLQDAQVADCLERVGFVVRSLGEGYSEVTVPSFRLECSREVDLVEEVARIWGYQRIEPALMAVPPRESAGSDSRRRLRRTVRALLAGAGYREAWTSTFIGPEDLARSGLEAPAPGVVEVENPLDSSQSLLRPSLLPGLLNAARFNFDRQAETVCLFELGRVFAAPVGSLEVPTETEMLGLLVAPGKQASPEAAVAAAVRSWAWLASAAHLEGLGLVERPLRGLHSGRSMELVSVDGHRAGMLGEVSPEVLSRYGLPGRVAVLELDLQALLDALPARVVAREPSRFPAADLDLAVVVDEAVPAAEVRQSLLGASELVEQVSLFDTYRGPQVGPGRRSLAFRLRLRAADRTLGEEDLAEVRSQALSRLQARHGATLRS